MKISVVIATYNMPAWLEKVLWGYEDQTVTPFEILIADDGSSASTRAVIERFQAESSTAIHHLWQEDRGYRRQRILNQAIVATAGDYVIFTDGDCIPRRDFVATHANHATRGRFLSGGYCKLPMSLSEAITREDISNQRCFAPDWLRQRGLHGRSQLRKLSARGRSAVWLDRLTTSGATFNNCNSSAWRSDLIAVNGYDERMQYGGADREIGERLVNAGVRGMQIRHRAICLHLDHARGYKTGDSIGKNREIRRQTRSTGRTRTEFGIESFRSDAAA